MHPTRRELHAVEVVQRVVQRPFAADRRDVLRHAGQVTRALGVVERLHQVLDEIRGTGCFCAGAEHWDDAAGGECSNDVTERVLGLGGANALEARLLPKDRRIEALEVGPGLDPELVDEGPAGGLVRLQCLCLAPRAIQRKHQLASKTFTVWMLRHQRLQLGDQLGVPIQLELDCDPFLEHTEMELLETPDVVLRPELVGEVHQGRAAPEGQRLSEQARALGRLGFSRAPNEPLKPGQVELVGFEPEAVAGGPGLEQQSRPERLAELRDEILQRGRRRARRALAPEQLDQAFGRDDIVRPEQEHGEQCTLLLPGEQDRGPVVQHLEAVPGS